MRKSLSIWSILPWLLITSGVLLLIFRVLMQKKNQDDTDDDVIIIEPDDEEPEPSKEQRIVSHYKMIREVFPAEWSDDVIKMVTAHAMHESGNFKSRLYKQQNNLFGMRHPVIRDTLSQRDQNGFATFANLEDAIKDLLLYFKEFKEGPKYAKVNDYVKMLNENGYFTTNYIDYFNPMRTHYNKVKSLIQ